MNTFSCYLHIHGPGPFDCICTYQYQSSVRTRKVMECKTNLNFTGRAKGKGICWVSATREEISNQRCFCLLKKKDQNSPWCWSGECVEPLGGGGEPRKAKSMLYPWNIQWSNSPWICFFFFFKIMQIWKDLWSPVLFCVDENPKLVKLKMALFYIPPFTNKGN